MEAGNKEQIIDELKSFGVIVCQPECRSVRELRAVLSVFRPQEVGEELYDRN